MESSNSSQKGQKTLLSFGSGGPGVLLQKDTEDLSSPQPIFHQKNWKIISVGGTRALGITGESEVYQWGEIEGGIATKSDASIEPMIVDFPIKILVNSISCGWTHCLCLSNEEAVYAWGDGKQGQLGLGDNRMAYFKEPQRTKCQEPIKIVKAGFRQSYFVTKDNDLIFCGSNKFLEMGVDTTNKTLAVPTKVELEGASVIAKATDILKIVTGHKHAALFTKKGELYVWGDNSQGQLGIKLAKETKRVPFTKLNPEQLQGRAVKDIESGWSHLTLLTDEGSVYIAGRNNFGQQGCGEDTQSKDCFHEICLPDPAKKICCGSESSFVIDQKDRVWTWGWNEHGNLGLGHTKNIYSPMVVPFPEGSKIDEIYAGGASVFFQLDGFKE